MFDDEDDENYFEGDLTKDIESFESYLKGGSIGYYDVDRLEAMVDHYLISGQYKKGRKCAEYALSMFSFAPIFKLRLAQALTGMGKLKESLNVLGEIEKSMSEDTEWLLTKASIFSQLKDSKLAIRFFRAALEKADKEDKDEIYLDLAMELENASDYKGAIEVLKAAMQHNPKNEGAIYELAYCYDQLDDAANAIKSYSDFIEENPYSFTSWYNLANAYSKNENYEKAIWAYDYCLIINEDFGPAYFNLGNAYLSQEKYKLAIENFEKCMEIDGDDPVALCYIGEAYEQLDQLALAKMFYQRSMEMAPLLPDAWLGMGIVHDLEGKTFEALTFIFKALELDDQNAGIYHVLAGAYEKLGETELAIENYMNAINLDHEDEETLGSLIDLLFEKDPNDALNFILNFEENFGDNEHVPLHITNVYWCLGKKTEAMNYFRAFFQENPILAKEIFDINPDLKKENAFINLFEA